MCSECVGGVIKCVLKLITDPVINYVSYIKKCDDNKIDLVQKLNELGLKKRSIDGMVTRGTQNLERITERTALWFQSIRELTKGPELMNLMISDDDVAFHALQVIEPKILQELLKGDQLIQDMVVRVLMKHKDSEASAWIARVVVDVLRNATEEFKNAIKLDTEMAEAALDVLGEDELKYLEMYDKEFSKVLGRVRSKSHVNEEEVGSKLRHEVKIRDAAESTLEPVGNLFKPLGELLEDESFKKAVPGGVPEGLKLGLVIMEGLLSTGLRKEMKERIDRQQRDRCCLLAVVVSFHESYQLSKDMESLVKEIKGKMIDKCPVNVTVPTTLKDLIPIPNRYMYGLESREELLANVIEKLMDGKVNSVAVFGIGGGGKTTLAKEVVARAKDIIGEIVMVEISITPTIERIQDEIANAVGMTLGDMHSIPQRAMKIYNRLKQEQLEKKKKLIILDNIWGKLNLEEVGIPLDYCKLLLTTRDEGVCKLMGVQQSNIFHMGLLNETEAKDLFMYQIKMQVMSKQHKCLIDKLLSKCGGLPLAIVTISNALKNQDLPMWQRFSDNLEKRVSSQVSGVHREIYSVLQTSYEFIDSEEKKMFFLLACLSPSGSSISVEELMRYGIGLELFQSVNNLSEAMEEASAWADELVSSSLLLKENPDGDLKVHDLVREFAILSVDRDKQTFLVESIPRWMGKETFKKFTAISLWSGRDFISRLNGVHAQKLRILVLKGDTFAESSQLNIFHGMENLKILSLSDMNLKLGLPNSLGELWALKTLHLHRCLLQDVGVIGKLSNLLVLSFHGSTLEIGLSEDIGNLSNLRLLDMNGCKGNLYIPANMLSRLSKLEGLYLLDSFCDWANYEVMEDTHSLGETSERASSTNELTEMPHLNVLEINVLKLDQLPNDDQIIENLGKSRIHVGDFNELDIMKLRRFQHVVKLNDLKMRLWLQNDCFKALLKKVVWLQLTNCSKFENLFPQLDEEGFKDLKILQLKECQEMISFVNLNDQESSPIFRNLESLELSALYELEKICDGIQPPRMFSNLQSLKLEYLPKLAYVLSTVALGSLNLIELSIQFCKPLEYIFIVKGSEGSSGSSKEDEIGNEACNFGLMPRLKRLDVCETKLMCVLGTLKDSENVQAEEAFFNEMSMSPSLESLSLKYSDLTKSLWGRNAHTRGFPNLKVIELIYCERLECLGPPSMIAKLVHLEQLSFMSCREMKEVISKEITEDEIVEHTILFPSLKLLELQFMYRLELFYGGNYKLEFPSLHKLSIQNSSEMSKFVVSPNSNAFFSDKVEFPLLEELDVKSCGSSNCETISFKPIPKLRNLHVGGSQWLMFIPLSMSQNLSRLEVSHFKDIKTLLSSSPPNKEVFCTYSQLPNLTELVVFVLDDMEELLENGEDDVSAINFCQQIRVLTLEWCMNMNVIPLHLFKNLRELYLISLSWEFLISANLIKTGSVQFQLLEILEIKDCENMKVVVEDNGNDHHRVYNGFPRLKRLHLERLTQLTSFRSRLCANLCFPSLEHLIIKYCYNFKSFCTGCFIAPELKQLVLVCCGLQYFVGGEVNQDNDGVIVHQLPNLENVDIDHCKSMSSFSPQPLPLPKLRQVTLQWCDVIEMFLPGHLSSNHYNTIQHFPSLEALSISNCPSMKSFSTTPIAAPKFAQLEIDKHLHVKLSNEELINLLTRLKKDLLFEGEAKEEEDNEEEKEEDDYDKEEVSED